LTTYANGRLERYHRTFREEGWRGEQPADYTAALALITDWVQRYNTLRLHSALQYLTPWDYYRGDPVARITERRHRLQTARTRRREAWEAYYAAAHPAA
jgi:transposase InsO family protein